MNRLLLTLSLTGLFVFGVSIAAEVRASDLTVYGSEWIKHTDAFLCMEMYNATDSNPAGLFLRRSKGTTVDSLVAVGSDTVLGTYEMQGWDGSNWQRGALWYAKVDGSPGSGAMPSLLCFAVSPSGQSSPQGKLFIRQNGYVGIGSTPNPGYPLEVNGTIQATNGYIRALDLQKISSRDCKLGIVPVPASGRFVLSSAKGNLERTGAWDLLDRLNVVDYEYKKMKRHFLLIDGRTVDSLDNLTSTVTQVVNGQIQTQTLCAAELVVSDTTEWIDEGSGRVHRGFIAEDVPDEFTPDHKTLMVGDIEANNTAALKEAKRRILELEKNGGGFDTQLAAVESARADLAKEVQQLATGVIRVEDLKPGAENTAVVMQLTESVLRQLGVDPWVEIALADAIETVPETTPVTSVKAVTKYRLNIASRQIEPYTVEESVTEQVPTGKTVERLKAGVRFDEGAGKLYRWVGLSSADAAQKLAALRTANQIASLPVSNLANPKLAAR
jgi:hypothetical protein